MSSPLFQIKHSLTACLLGIVILSYIAGNWLLYVGKWVNPTNCPPRSVGELQAWLISHHRCVKKNHVSTQDRDSFQNTI